MNQESLAFSDGSVKISDRVNSLRKSEFEEIESKSLRISDEFLDRPIDPPSSP
jgi:hypothetical protein